MNLQEAIKTGLKFKRDRHPRYFIDNGNYVDDVDDDGNVHGSVLTTEDMLATDWKVQEVVSVNREIVIKAANSLGLNIHKTSVLLMNLGFK